MTSRRNPSNRTPHKPKVKEEQPDVVVAISEENKVTFADFVDAMKRGITKMGKCRLVELGNSKDYFCVYLGFSGIDDAVTAVSAVLGFHEGHSDADYFLQHWSGHFLNRKCRDNAKFLLAALDAEISKQIAQGRLRKLPRGLLLSPNEQVIKTVAKRLAAAFWSFHRDQTFDEALAATEADFDEKDDEPWIALADRLVWYLLKGIGEKQPSLKEHIQ
jgi:hypothetical protein